MNNTQLDNAKDIDVVMPMYNLIEHSYNYSKTSGRIIQIIIIQKHLFYRDEPAIS